MVLVLRAQFGHCKCLSKNWNPLILVEQSLFSGIFLMLELKVVCQGRGFSMCGGRHRSIVLLNSAFHPPQLPSMPDMFRAFQQLFRSSFLIAQLWLLFTLTFFSRVYIEVISMDRDKADFNHYHIISPLVGCFGIMRNRYIQLKCCLMLVKALQQHSLLSHFVCLSVGLPTKCASVSEYKCTISWPHFVHHFNYVGLFYAGRCNGVVDF